MHAHFAGDMCQDDMLIIKFDLECGVRERFFNRSFKYNGIFFWLGQDSSS